MYDDDNEELQLNEVEEMLANLGYTDDEIGRIVDKLNETLADPEYQAAIASGEKFAVALTLDESGYDIDSIEDPAIKAAMQELYFSDVPPTIH